MSGQDDVSELRLLLWDMAARVERVAQKCANLEAARLLRESASDLRQAHMAIYFAQLELRRQPSEEPTN